ncbi:MAG: hypothetical protein FGM15_03910 [Chthoniobacterales bacterium]|nr:hypothetical protein [Chthoniobacterales bacterium]
MDSPSSSQGAPRKKSIWPMFAGGLVLFLVFAGLVQWMRGASDRAAFDEEAIRAKQRYEILAKVKDDNAKLTAGYAWADQAKGLVRIPLDHAMELAVKKLSAQGDPRPAYPVDPALPLGSAVKPGGLAVPAPTPPPFETPAAPSAQPVPQPAEKPAAATEEVAP